ncbi:MAG: hypothetical protein HDR72_03905 [Ruminococcaceae bacterium]|nr:hypothetical protein [Oscillospiraceae bacterium]
MKYIIAFVLLGLVTYAGVFLLYYGIRQSVENNRSPIAMTSVPWQQYVSGMAVSARIDQQFGKRFTATVKRKIFDIEYGEPIVQHYYVIPAGKVFSPTEQYYMLICVTDEEDVRALDGLYSEKLLTVGSETPFECRGVLGAMDPPFVEELSEFFVYKAQLIKDEELVEIFGDPALTMPTHINGYNRICQYVFYVQKSKGGEELPIIIGAALTAAGAGGIALLAVKKHRESTGY